MKLEPISRADLASVSGGMKWQGRPQSTNVEDRRPSVVCSAEWPQGNQGPREIDRITTRINR